MIFLEVLEVFSRTASFGQIGAAVPYTLKRANALP